MLVGEMVELHLMNGKRFLGKVTVKDDQGVVLYCVPVKALESVMTGANAVEDIREMLQTVYFAWQQIEYIDIGGEPMGFDSLYGSWFQNIKVTDFFEKPYQMEKDLR